MTALLIATCVSETALVAAIFFGIRHRDRRIQRDLNAAIAFALGLRHMLRAHRFLRLFHDGDTETLQAEFPDWFDYRDDAYGMEAC